METPTKEVRTKISFWHKLRVVATFVLAAWLVASAWIHLIHAIRVATGAKPTSATWHLPWPHPNLRYSTPAPKQITGGVVSPGVRPGTGPGDTGDLPADDFCSCRPSKEGDAGIDLQICIYEGKQVCFLCPFQVPVPMWLCTLGVVIVLCYFLAIAIGALFEWICRSEWVREEIRFDLCRRRKCKWYDLVCHARKLVCFTCTAFRWLLQQICGWVEVIVWGTGIACVIAGVVVIVALL